jgi:hypothetical protein
VQPWGPRSGEAPITFERVRTLGLREAVYVAARRPDDPPFFGTFSVRQEVRGPFELDLSGGMSEPIDLGATR